MPPIMWSQGSGVDVMKRIATPMIGGGVTPVIMELVVFLAVYYLWRSRSLANHLDTTTGNDRKWRASRLQQFQHALQILVGVVIVR